jgi:hypothetical protein
MDNFSNMYMAVLGNEIEVLKREYYKPNEEGTGHFNTAISVLQHRIDEIKNGKPVQVHID